MIKKGISNNMIEKNNTYLNIILDDNDDFLECIEQGFREHDVQKAVIISTTGTLKNVIISTTRSGSLRQKTYNPSCKIRYVSGEFYKSKEDYFGDVHISIAKDQIHQITGILLGGVADGEVNIKFKIIKDYGHQQKVIPAKPMTMLKQKILNDNKPKEKKPIIEA